MMPVPTKRRAKRSRGKRSSSHTTTNPNASDPDTLITNVLQGNAPDATGSARATA